jgi:chromosome segregation ATPase
MRIEQDKAIQESAAASGEAQKQDELLFLQKETELMEARGKLAEARKKLAETEGSIDKLRQPWWRNGLTVTTLAAIISAIVPLTTQIQSWKDQAMKEKEMNFEIREKYLSAVIRDPRQEKRVLQFIVVTADDTKMQEWAKAELKAVEEKVATLDNTAVARKKLYLETIGVVASLADSITTKTEWEAHLARFWRLYQHELLAVESPEVESLMVKIGHELKQCKPGECKTIENLAYQLARQMKMEISADAAVVTPPEKVQTETNDAIL